MQKGQIFIFLLVGILILAATGGYLVYTNYSNSRYKNSRSQNPAAISPASTQQDNQTPQPISNSSPIPSPYQDPWQNYESGKNIDGVIINYPVGWKVNYRKEYKPWP